MKKDAQDLRSLVKNFSSSLQRGKLLAHLLGKIFKGNVIWKIVQMSCHNGVVSQPFLQDIFWQLFPVSEKNLKETAPMILARWKTAAYKDSSVPRKLAEVMKGMKVAEEDFRPQKANTKRGSTSGQTWEVDVGKEWLSTQHQATGKQVATDPLERKATRNTARPRWVALETMKELEDCLKKLDRGLSRKRRH